MRARASRVLVFLASLPLLFLSTAFLFRGPARSFYIVMYKERRLRAGSLFFRPGWGWVDLVHYRIACARLARVEAELSAPSGGCAATLSGSFQTALGGWEATRRRYRVPGCERLSPSQRRAVSVGIVLDMALAEENAQAAGRLWHGTDISAYQFDDLPSVWLAGLERLGLRERDTEEKPSPERLRLLSRRLLREGVALAARRIAEPADFPEQSAALRRLSEATAAVRGRWTPER
ncbi:MAG: hypothetical protein HY553_04920 [Elusimicrobia bacterium]|nr:hypothetical protein [Elusimicrobiota bacterium]